MIYLDSNVLIRLVEGAEPARRPIERRLAGQTQFLTSQLTRLECRCKPIRDGNTALLRLYDIAFSASEMRLVELDQRVIDEATAIRARLNFKTPDSIQLAAAVVSGAKVFLTGDSQLARFTSIPVEII